MVLPWCFLWATVIAHVVCSFPIAVISHHKLGSVKQHTDSLSCGAGGQRPRRVFPRLWSRCGQDLVPPRGCTGKFRILDFSPFLEVVYSSLVCGPLHPQSHKALSHLSDSDSDPPAHHHGPLWFRCVRVNGPGQAPQLRAAWVRTWQSLGGCYLAYHTERTLLIPL